MIVGKYVDGITLMQPIEQVEKIESLSSYNRNAAGETMQNNSFAAMFAKAKQQATNNKSTNSNGFDVLC